MTPLRCTAPGCTNNSRCRDYCDMHRRRLQRYGTLTAPTRATGCMYVDCDNKHKANNLCDVHYRWTRNPLPPHCQHPGCPRLPRNNAHCARHRTPTTTTTPPPPEDDDLHHILTEYHHFKGFGWTDDKIAARLGTTTNAIAKRLQRNGVLT